MSKVGKEFEPFKENAPIYKMVIFDVDGTLVNASDYQGDRSGVGASTWHLVFNSLGIPSEHQRLRNKYMAGKHVNYMKWTREACEVLKANGLTEAKFLEVINNQPFMNGAKELFTELKKLNCKTAVITGGFSTLAERVKKEFGIDYAVGHCDLKFKEGKLNRWDLLPCDSEGKPNFFLKIADECGVRPSQCIYR